MPSSTTAITIRAFAIPSTYRIHEFDPQEAEMVAATEAARARSRSLEHLFADLARTDAASCETGEVSIRGEVFTPSDMLPMTFARFLSWAETEGLVTVTPKGRSLSGGGWSPVPTSN